MDIFVKPTVNKNNGQIRIDIPKKELSEKLKSHLSSGKKINIKIDEKMLK
jgi:hypothetical protein